MAVEQDDFRHLMAGDLPFTAQAQHMFCMLAFALIPYPRLAGKERAEAFPLQVIQQGDGRDIRVTLTA